MRRFSAAVSVLTLLFATAVLATAQDAATIRAIFASAPKTPTSVGGVEIFAAPPKGFNPLTATGTELARYGLPQRPDQTTAPERYAMWARAMTSLKTTPTDVRASSISHGPMKPVNASTPSAEALANVPVTVGSSNWSGIVNTNKDTKWSAVTSFTYIESYWPVPVSQPPIDACANGITGPFHTSSWNGIDGFDSGDVVQGGTDIYANCSGGRSYVGWVEWYPSYPELDILCGASACPVGPGDVMEVVTYAVAGTAAQTIYIENTTQGWGGSFSLAWVQGPGVIGNSEEQIVERPCCVTVGNNPNVPFALDHYNYEWFSDAWGTDGHGTLFYVGEQTATTYNVQMYDDLGDQVISEVLEQGSAGNAGKYSVFFSDEGCAYSGGCTP